MEQYLLQLPKRLAQEVRAGIAVGDSADVEMISGGALRYSTGLRGRGTLTMVVVVLPRCACAKPTTSTLRCA